MNISHLTVQGFRRLESVEDLELRPLTVVIGANGSGKTSLLDALSLIAYSAAGCTKETLGKLGGLDSVLTRGRQAPLKLGVCTPPTTGAQDREFPPLKYALDIDARGQSYVLAHEMLSQQLDPAAPEPFKHIEGRGQDVRYLDTDSKRLVKPTWDYDHLETALAQVPKMHRHCESFRQRLASLAHYAARDLRLGRRSPVRAPQPMQPATLPGSGGENLVSCLYYLRETDRDRFDMVQDGLSAAFPSFDRLEFPPVAAGTLAITWKDRDFDRPIYAHELSDGALRFLWLLTLLNSPGLTAITLIDEPEVSFHPSMLRVLTDLLREAATRTQIVVATHSERLIRFLQPSEVLVLDLQDGRALPRWADSLDLDAWLEDYTLDELWRMNRLGGNP